MHFSSGKSSQSSSQRRCSPSLEYLEPRTLLSVDLTGGLLSIGGTNRSDQIQVSKDPTTGQLVAILDGLSYSFDMPAVQQIQIDGGGGHDFITIDDEIQIDATISGGSGKDHIRGGGGDDFIHGDQGRDLLDGGAGDDDLFGDSGSDSVRGGLGDDTCHGGTGNDHLDGEEGSNLLDGDAGHDQEEHGLSVDLETEFEASLQGAGGAFGASEFEMEQEDDGLEVEFKLELHHAMPDSVFDVVIDGILVGQVATDSSGNGCLKFSNDPDDADEIAFPELFPEVHAGSQISVGTQASGVFQVEVS